MLYQCGSCQYFNPGASMCFSYIFIIKPSNSQATMEVVKLRKLGQQGKGDLLCQGLRKELSLSKKGTLDPLEITDMAHHGTDSSDRTMAYYGYMKKGRQTTETIWCIWCLIHLWIVVLQIYPKHPKTSQNIHVACVCSKSLVQIDTAGRQICSPWQRFRFRPCSQVHPVSPSARPNQQKQPQKDQK